MNGLLARATNALEVRHGVRGGRVVTAALAVSGQTRIHWESSARGALHIVLGCTSFMLPQNLKSRVAAVVRRCCGDPQQGARRALGEEMD